jgi:hypothetical protein
VLAPQQVRANETGDPAADDCDIHLVHPT